MKNREGSKTLSRHNQWPWTTCFLFLSPLLSPPVILGPALSLTSVQTRKDLFVHHRPLHLQTDLVVWAQTEADLTGSHQAWAEGTEEPPAQGARGPRWQAEGLWLCQPPSEYVSLLTAQLLHCREAASEQSRADAGPLKLPFFCFYSPKIN